MRCLSSPPAGGALGRIGTANPNLLFFSVLFAPQHDQANQADREHSADDPKHGSIRHCKFSFPVAIDIPATFRRLFYLFGCSAQKLQRQKET
jgi:hypothetical protein